MKTRALAEVVAGGLALGVATATHAEAQTAVSKPAKEVVVTNREARGTFEVKLTPQPVHTATGGATLGRMTIDKQFHGDLDAVSTGEMLSAMTAVQGSAGYVAMELVRGTLHGRKGTFVLQHSAFMTRGTPGLTVTVVPDSGTDELVGLAGKMEIIIEEGRHSYKFDYTLPGG